ncbi:MAG: glycosyltransferase [Patescibacteria group bacterium]
MKIIYAGARFENYNFRRRQSFEYVNFFLTLSSLPGVEVIELPFDHILEIGKERFNRELLDTAKQGKPDLFFVFMYTDELLPSTLETLRQMGVPTLAWFADDYWRFWNYSKHWAPLFSYAVTTSPQALGWYAHSDIHNVIGSQWACNTAQYGPRPMNQDIDVSFVGQYKPGRGRIVQMLERQGIAVQAYGFGWPRGGVSHEEMLQIFSRSRINLNLNERPSRFEARVLARLFLRKSIDRLVLSPHLVENAQAWWHFSVPHTHARPFELAGCGAFVISGKSANIKQYYVPGQEMEFYETPEELVKKVRYYLDHTEQRKQIAKAGYERTIRDHTYEKRFREIFSRIGV